MTPDAGKSRNVSSNRGFVFIPEVGDQVLLGFRHGDPARPYVMGSLFNGSTGGGGGQGNKCKSLTTRSGSSLKLDDSDGSVTLHDKGGVSMNFDGAGNATTTTANNHQVYVGSQYSANIAKGVSTLTMDSNGVIDLSGNSKVTIKVGASSIELTQNDISISGTTIKMIGDNNIITGLSNTKIDGSSANIETSGLITIKGSETDIN